MDPLNNNQNQVAAGNQFPPPDAPQKSSTGPIAGAVIVIVLLIAGGLYFWGAKLNQEGANNVPYIPGDNTMMEGSMIDENAQPMGQLQSDTSAGLPPQSSSDDVSSIESDFNAMDLDQMQAENDAEFNSI